MLFKDKMCAWPEQCAVTADAKLDAGTKHQAPDVSTILVIQAVVA